MKYFSCSKCANALYFENSVCLGCGTEVGFLPSALDMFAFEVAPDGLRLVGARFEARRYLRCENSGLGGCNWLLPAEGAARRCEACRHNRVVPDLSSSENQARWRKLEQAKRRLFYSIVRWRLPAPDRTENPNEGLAFDFLADVLKPNGAVDKALTGHEDGVITINIAEADDGEREARRAAVAEPYRTLLGHFRHEIGHYYWDRLVRDGGRVYAFRDIFGDERADYAAALKNHYDNGPRPDWAEGHISAYASVHPWEDFAETWAHYMHIVDTLETSRAFAVKVANVEGDAEEAEVAFQPYRAPDAKTLVEAWTPLTIAVNSLNRSMGQPDIYPFVLSTPVVRKLQFVHDCVAGAR